MTRSVANSRVVEWYRADESKRVVRVLARGASLVVFGACAVAASLILSRYDVVWRHVASIVGGLATALGPVMTIVGLNRILREDTYVALLADGVLCGQRSGDSFIPWDELETADYDTQSRELRFHLVDERCFSLPFEVSGMSTANLAKRVNAIRLKALFRLI